MDGVVPPGGTIGILGGGQLGRMLSLAAARLGLKTSIYAPEHDSPAFDVCHHHVVARYDDRDALERFARGVDVVTYEFENVPGNTAAVLSGMRSVRPNPLALSIIQDRFEEKSFIKRCGLKTTPFALVSTPEELKHAGEMIGAPSVLKTARLGYDGKGQRVIRTREELSPAWAQFKQAPCILEGFVQFKRELSIIGARNVAGELACYDVVENQHENHILKRTLAPARISQSAKAEARRIIERLLKEFDYTGVMAVEIFETNSGDLLINEIAPRVHNSGHWTIDGCVKSQFELHIRAVCGWPLGDTSRHSDAIMSNLLGAEIHDWVRAAQDHATAVHLYGKGEPREGRKMGHITKLYPLGTRPEA